MQKIKKLSMLEIQKIAAGQVVERPADVVKELIENSIDAHATKVSIYLEEGGQKSIRIVDNGCGMSYEDAHACFEHHATSKINSVDDLKQCMTFGFRGEALSSIASVSTVTITTKEHDAMEGITIVRQADRVLSEKSVACPHGTDITVHDIFYNIPVRKKFLKKEETELRIISQLFQTFCLAFNAIHFQLYHNDAMIYNCPPVHLLTNRMTQLFNEYSDDLLVLSEEKENSIKVNGLISNQQVQRYNKNQVFFFVNKRWIKNYSLVKALLKGYKNALQPDRYPVAVVLIDIAPEIIDVNIHPRKEEVWFSNASLVEAYLSTLVNKTLQQTVSYDLQQSTIKPLSYAPSEPFFIPAFSDNSPFDASPAEWLSKPIVQEKIEIKQEKQEEIKAIHYNIIGIAHRTYIMVEHTDGILFVDQHAAHERILFELFQDRVSQSAITLFAIPYIIELSHDNIVLIQHHVELFEKHGIELEIFGSNKIIIKAAPSYLKSFAWQPFLHTLLEEFKSNENNIDEQLIKESIMFKFRALMACKAAVKAGDVLTREQAHQLLVDLDKSDNHMTCPHGRPTRWVLRINDIEKKFKR